MLKNSTITKILKAIIQEGKTEAKNEERLAERRYLRAMAEKVANEATIYFKTAQICENKGIDEAMKYFAGNHHMEEYLEFLPKSYRRSK